MITPPPARNFRRYDARRPDRRGARASLAQPLRAHHRALCAGRADRHHRPRGRRPACEDLGPADRDREPRGRGWQHRRRGCRTIRARRLHDVHGRRLARGQPQLLSHAQLRPDRRFRAGLAHLQLLVLHVRAELVAGEVGRGIHRLCPQQQRQGHLCIARHRQRTASLRRAVRTNGRDRDDTRALSRRGAGDERSHSRARRPPVLGRRHLPICQVRPGARARGQRRQEDSVGA